MGRRLVLELEDNEALHILNTPKRVRFTLFVAVEGQPTRFLERWVDWSLVEATVDPVQFIAHVLHTARLTIQAGHGFDRGA